MALILKVCRSRAPPVGWNKNSLVDRFGAAYDESRSPPECEWILFARCPKARRTMITRRRQMQSVDAVARYIHLSTPPEYSTTVGFLEVPCRHRAHPGVTVTSGDGSHAQVFACGSSYWTLTNLTEVSEAESPIDLPRRLAPASTTAQALAHVMVLWLRDLAEAESDVVPEQRPELYG